MTSVWAPRGRAPQSDVAAHAARVAVAQRVVADVRYLGGELRRLLEVVVLTLLAIGLPVYLVTRGATSANSGLRTPNSELL